jgi:hypothetical protein
MTKIHHQKKPGHDTKGSNWGKWLLLPPHFSSVSMIKWCGTWSEVSDRMPWHMEKLELT